MREPRSRAPLGADAQEVERELVKGAGDRRRRWPTCPRTPRGAVSDMSGLAGLLRWLGARALPRSVARGAGAEGSASAPSDTRRVQTTVAISRGSRGRRRAGARPRRWPRGDPRGALREPRTPSSSRRSVPEPGTLEVIVRVMAAGVNYNNVWAALGEPVSVMRIGDAPRARAPHRRLRTPPGSCGRFGAGVTRWKPGDEVVVRLQRGLLRGPRGPRPRPDGRALAEDLGATR